jgi:Tol biopolymer transport system component
MSSVDWVPELAAALDRLVPLEDSSRADWGDVVGRAGRRRRLRFGLPHRSVRLAIVIAVIFLLLAGVATATYLLVRGTGGIVLDEYGRLLVVNQKGLALRTIARCAADKPNCAITEASWSPDGERLAFVRGHLAGPLFGRSKMSVYVAPSDGGAARRLAFCGLCAEPSGGLLAWSPNGRWIAFSRDDGHRGIDSLWVVAAAGGPPHHLTRCRRCSDGAATWSPNGQLLLFSRGWNSERLYTVHRDGSGLKKIANGTDPQWSPDGRRIAFDNRDGIVVANADGSDAHLLVIEKGGTGPGVPSWSPNGRKLAFVKTPSARGGLGYRYEIWTMNADGSAKKRLYHSGCCTGGGAGPIWSPDGRLIAFSDGNSAGGTFVINADGTGLHRLSPAAVDLAWQSLPQRKPK